MTALHYRQVAATQAAARLLKARGGRMSYLKLIKLLYLADRKALLEHHRPITYDRFVSMDFGPVLSQTYNLIVAEQSPNAAPSYWRQYISEPEKYVVSLLQDAPNSELSAAQEEVLDSIFAEFGKLSRWQLVDLTHGLPEWENPFGSSVPISVHEVLKAGGLEEGEVEAVEETLAAEDALAELLK
jgi:uncharacterized phage-associated protein